MAQAEALEVGKAEKVARAVLEADAELLPEVSLAKVAAHRTDNRHPASRLLALAVSHPQATQLPLAAGRNDDG